MVYFILWVCATLDTLLDFVINVILFQKKKKIEYIIKFSIILLQTDVAFCSELNITCYTNHSWSRFDNSVIMLVCIVHTRLSLLIYNLLSLSQSIFFSSFFLSFLNSKILWFLSTMSEIQDSSSKKKEIKFDLKHQWQYYCNYSTKQTILVGQYERIGYRSQEICHIANDVINSEISPQILHH